MASAIGAAALIGIGEEVTEGTGVTVTAFLAVRNLDMNRAPEYDVVEPLGYNGDAAPAARSLFVTADNAGGSFQTSLYYNNQVMTLFKHLFGDVTDGGTGPSSYTHTYDWTRAQPTAPSLTLQANHGTGPQNLGETFTGCRLAKCTIEANVGQVVTATWEFLAKTSGGMVAPTAPTYQNATVVTHNHATAITWNGTALAQVTSCKIMFDKMLERTPELGSLTSGNMLQAGLTNIEIEVTQRWASNTLYAALLAGSTYNSDTITFTDGTFSYVFTFAKLQVIEAKKTVSGAGSITVTTKIKALAREDVPLCQLVLTNDVS